MFRPRIDLELGQQARTEPVLGQHPLHSVEDQPLRVLGSHLLDRAIAFAAFPAGVRHILLGAFFVAGQADLGGVHHHHEVAEIQVWRVHRFVLAAKHIRHLSSKTTQDGAVGIDNMPTTVVRVSFGNQGFHPVQKTKERGTYQTAAASQ